ncbi:MAG: SDR family oxidoreductase [Rhodospirillales bacterium]|nr:SDR family oxidoreductase [Rhodospirillales bacterium]
MNGTFAGKIAVVTGGTQGLGETTARLFAERGAAGLVICGRNAARGEAVAAELTAGGCQSLFVAADLADMEACRSVIAAADAAFGRVDHLINCAAITDRGTILDTSPELFDRMFAINVRAPYFLIQDAVKLMIRDKTEGSIVNILSMSGLGGQPFISAYSASKGALEVVTKNTAFSLMRNRIRVNGLNIGWMNSPGEHAIQKREHDAPDDWLEAATAGMPLGRLLETAEVARSIAFLASAESGLMTGSIINMDQSVDGCYDDPPRPATAMAL